MLSLGMLCARAARTAARRRGFMFGSGSPVLAATVISRASLPNSLERAASWRPLRCMMFLNCECPAMARNGLWSARLIRCRGGEIQEAREVLARTKAPAELAAPRLPERGIPGGFREMAHCDP